MSAQTLLVIDAQGLKAWQHAGRTVERCAQFDGFDESSANHFREWLHSRPGRSCYTLLADLAEERFALERLPRAGLADSRAMIRRKLGQHFPDTGFTTSLPLGCQDSGAALRRVLLGALTRPALLTPWIGALTAAGAIVTRLTSTPLLLDQWNRRRLRQTGQFVLLMLTASGMRLTLFTQGRLRFSRVVPPRADSLSECQPSYAAELAQTRSYLAAQHLIEHDAPLPVTVLAAPSDLPILSTIVDAEKGLDVRFVDLRTHLLRRPRMATTSGSDATPLMVQQLMRSPPSAHYTPSALHREHTVRRLRTGIIGAATLASAACLLAAGANLLESASLERKAAALEEEERALTRESDALVRERPSVPVPAAEVDAWLLSLERHAARAISPVVMLQRISTLLEAFPALRLDSLRWRPAELPRDGLLLPPEPTGGTSVFVVVDLGASLPSGPVHDPDEAYRRSATLIDRLQHDLGPQLQARHFPSTAGDPARSQAAPAPAAVDERHHLALRFALPLPGMAVEAR